MWLRFFSTNMITKRIQAKTETSFFQAYLQSVVSLWNCQTKTSHLDYFYMDVQVYLCNLQRNNAPSLSESYLNNRSGLALWCLQTIHLFTVSLCLNTFLTFQRLLSIQKSAKRKRETAFFFSFSFFFYPYRYSRYTKIPWELPGTLRGGGNNGLYCPSSIGIQWRSVWLCLWTTVSCGRTVVVRLTRSDAKSTQVFRYGTERSSGKTN